MSIQRKPKQLELFDPQSKQRKSPIGVTFAPEDIAMLDAIQRRYDMSRSAAIRACVHRVYKMLEVD
jgi:hypothetical protein